MALSKGAILTLASNAGASTGTAAYWYGGKGVYTAEATWGGGSSKLQFKTQNGTWLDYTSGSLTANGYVTFELPACEIRVVIATSSAVYAYAMPI